MNPDSFMERVLPLKNKLYRYAFSYLKHAQESEDIVQEVFVKLWKKRDSLHELRSIDAWCMTLVKNLSIDRIRAGKYRMVGIQNDIRPYDMDPHMQTETRDMMEKVHEVINNLSDSQKQVIILRDVEGYSYKEIGEITGMDQSLVKISLFRARENVRKKLLKSDNYGL